MWQHFNGRPTPRAAERDRTIDVEALTRDAEVPVTWSVPLEADPPER